MLSRARWNCREALTLIELLVVIGVIALLVGIILPAVFAARETARRAQCMNNLHQLGIALFSYSTSHGSLPPGTIKGYSVHALLLPFLEQGELYNAINKVLPETSLNMTSNVTIVGIKLAQFLCPSDRGLVDLQARNNYSWNLGVGFDRQGPLDNGAIRNPGSGSSKPTTLADFPDGTSSTIGAAECLVGVPEREGRDPRRSVLYFPEALVEASDFEIFAQACHEMDYLTAKVEVRRGWSWLRTGFLFTEYNHTLGINDHSCINGSSHLHGAWSASSAHGSLAHVLFVDGHVRSLKSSLDLNVWRALGTRNGGEVISEQSF